jgi:hypothetical protein
VKQTLLAVVSHNDGLGNFAKLFLRGHPDEGLGVDSVIAEEGAARLVQLKFVRSAVRHLFVFAGEAF